MFGLSLMVLHPQTLRCSACPGRRGTSKIEIYLCVALFSTERTRCYLYVAMPLAHRARIYLGS